MASLAAAAVHIDLGERRFKQLVDAGHITKRARGKYELDEVRVEYIRYLRAIAAGRSNETDELSAAKLRRAQADAEAAELELGQRQGVLVRSEDVERRWNKIGARLRTNLLALPSKMAPRCESKSKPEIEILLRDEIDHALEGISGKAA